MKNLYLFLMLLLPMAGFAQTITVTGAGTANFGSVSLNGTYSFAGTVNGKNSYSQNFSFSANGCQNCSASNKISWDGVSAWILTTQGSGFCSYCNFSTPTARTNTIATALDPPCSGWPGSMNISGACEGGAIHDFVLLTNKVCPTGTISLSWIKVIELGAGNIFTATLSDKYGSFSSGTVLLGTITSATASSMDVTIPGDQEAGAAYAIKLTASEAPSGPVSLTSSNITIGLPNDRPSVYQGTIEACEGQAVSMSTSSSYDSYQWYKQVGNVYTIIPEATSQSYLVSSVLEADQGDYSVQGKTAGGCVTLFSYPIPLNVSNSPKITNLGPANVNVCEGNTAGYISISMDNMVSGTFTYDWKKGSSIVKTETTTSNISLFSPSGGWQVGDAGQYTVVVSKVGCTSTATSQTATVRVDTPITTPPSVAPAGSQVAPVTLTPSGSYGQYRLFKWNGTTYDFITSTSEGSNFYVTQSGKYVVAAVNNCGESGYSNEVTVTTLCDTPPTITPATPTSLPATLTASAGYDSYEWYNWDGSSYTYFGSGSRISVTTSGQYAVKGYSYDCGRSDFSAPVTIGDPCANDLEVPTITSFPASVNSACGAESTWNVVASDNCTAAGSIIYKYYITGGSEIGDASNLQTGTGTGTIFTADAIVHLFAFDAANNKSTEAQISVNSCTAPTGIPTNGLIAWYPFNGNANDESGHNLHGTGTAVTLTADRFGNAGKAYDFNGSSSFIEVADNETYFRPRNITISHWVFTRPGSSIMTFISKPLGLAWANSWVAYTGQSGDNALWAAIGGGFEEMSLVSPQVPRTNETWTHVALTYDDDDANTMKFYINGVKVDEESYGSSILYDNSPVVFGKELEYGGNSNYFMHGKLDDIALYDRALSEAEITILYQQPCGPLATNQSGNFNDAGIWSCGSAPGVNDQATINAAHTVNFAGGMYHVSQLTNNGTITGAGTIGGSLYNNGILAPGNSPGTISVLDFTGTGSSIVNAEIAGTSSYDKLVITGGATLSGTLNVVFIDGFVPQVGDAFDLLTYSSHTGTFASLNLPALQGALIWKTDYNTSGLRLSVIVDPLPVTLISFNANVTDSQKVKLSWATTEEVNASHFVVERSSDAKNFGNITQVTASGTTRLRNEYATTDETPLSGINYYRLRQVDLDGKEYVYRTVAVKLEKTHGQYVFPNPTNRNVIEMTFRGKLPNIELHDASGRKVQINWIQTGLSVATIKPHSQLVPGLYILTTDQDGVKVIHKVIVMD